MFGVRRPTVRRRDRGMAPVLRRGEPVHADVRGLQGTGRGNGAQSTGRYPVPAGIVGHVHRRSVSGRALRDARALPSRNRIEKFRFRRYRHAYDRFGLDGPKRLGAEHYFGAIPTNRDGDIIRSVVSRKFYASSGQLSRAPIRDGYIHCLGVVIVAK